MKSRAVLWTIIVLVNVTVAAISFKTYQDISARIARIEIQQMNYIEIDRKEYDKKFKKSELSLKQMVANLLHLWKVDGKYDFNNNLVEGVFLGGFLNYSAYAETYFLLEVPEGFSELFPNVPKNIEKSHKTPVVVIGKYVLTASHTNDIEILRRQTFNIQGPPGNIFEATFEFKVLKYQVALLAPDGSKHRLKELYRNRETDFSLFEMQKYLPALNFPFKIGESDKLQIGNFTYINGQPGGIDSNIARPGYVTSLFAATGAPGGEVKKDYNQFSLSQSTDRGDSGFPIIVFRDGMPELIGIYLGWIGSARSGDNGSNTRSRALKIDVAIEEIKTKLGVDLRESQFNILYNAQ